MDPILVGAIGFIILFIIIALGIPVGFAILLVGFAGTWYMLSFNAAITKVAGVSFSTVANYSYSVLPLFIFMGEIILVTGIGRDLYDLGAKWLGRLPGGLAIATIAACALFGAVSSSAIAAVITIGVLAIPQMKRYHYDPKLSTATVALGGPLSILIPPSGILIIYGIMTETSIGKLFIAGILPGLTAALFYVVTIIFLCWRNPSLGPKGPSYSLREKIMAFGKNAELLALILLVLGGITVGWFTPTEAGAVGAFGAIVFSMVRRRLNWEKFKQATFDTMKASGMVYLLLTGIFMFQPFVALSNIPYWASDFISGLGLAPILTVIAMIAIYIILGTFMDELTLMLLTLPVFFPIVKGLGFDSIWFGIIITRMIMIGGYSPPYGLILFTINGIVPEVPMTTIWRGVIPFFVVDIFHVALLLFFPALVLVLPNLIR
jgi:C4-dicarboxylate transporter, DctM subunit